MKYNKSKIMKRAWEIAKEAQKNWGGEKREYLSESMKQAWREEKEEDEIVGLLVELANIEKEKVEKVKKVKEVKEIRSEEEELKWLLA